MSRTMYARLLSLSFSIVTSVAIGRFLDFPLSFTAGFAIGFAVSFWVERKLDT